MAGNTGTRIVRSPVVGFAQGERYYLSYRQPLGSYERELDINDEPLEYFGKLSVHSSKEPQYDWWDNSLLKKLLSEGESFYDKHGGVTVTLLGAGDTSAGVRVDVPNPLPTPTPTPEDDEGVPFYQFSGSFVPGKRKRDKKIDLTKLYVLVKNKETNEKFKVYPDIEGVFATLLFEGDYKFSVQKKLLRSQGVKS